MAQADGVVANGTGSAVRADINGQLAALFTNHSGSTAPATTFAFQTWADTNTNTLKLRNSANDGWIQLARLDGQFDAKTFHGNVTLNAQSDLRLADSDSSNWVAFQAPATVASNVTWTLPAADGTSGQTLQTNGSGTLSWSTPSASVDIISEGNTSAEVVDTGSDGHFKVVTEGTEALRVDAGRRLLVNTNTALANIKRYATSVAPTQQISTATSSWTNGLSLVNYSSLGYSPVLTFGTSLTNTQGANTIIASGTRMGTISFTGNDGTDFEEGARIEVQADGTPSSTSMPGRMLFYTTASGSVSPTARMTIKSDGNVGIATASPVAPLHVVGSDSNAAIILTAGNATSNVTQIAATNEAGSVWNQLDIRAHEIAFDTASTERVRITSTGNLQFNSGYGSVATAYGCRAWVNFNGTGTVAIRGNGNVSSITDNGVGDYTVNFTTAMADANYSLVVSSTYGSANGFTGTAPTTTAARVSAYTTTTGAALDSAYICVSVFR